MGRDSATSLAPGFRFHPTDEELVRYYLRRKVCNKPFRFSPIADTDVYKSEPWDLPDKAKLKTRDMEWYFFSVLDKKYGNGWRTNRATEKGYWKTTGKDRPVLYNSRTVCMKKTLVYHNGRAPRGERTNWVMHEYRLTDEELEKAGVQQDAFVLCRIFQKSGSGPKNGEQYGAPFVEEEWEDDEMDLVPGQEAVADEVVVSDGAFVEVNDVDKNVDIGNQSDDTPFQTNFYYGESSNQVEHAQEVNADCQQPVMGNDNIQCGLEPCYGQMISTLPEQNEMEANPVKLEYEIESMNNANPLDGNYPLGEPFFDANEGFFLEANDLSDPIEADAAGFDWEDYLTFLDADDEHVAVDSAQMIGSEMPMSDQKLLTEECLNGGTEQVSMPCQPALDETGNDGASSSKKKPEATKHEQGVKYPFIKQASHVLGSFPAPPAFASEFPTKDAALRLNSAAQSSSSIHFTAGMIRITNMTLYANGMDWPMGKNGDANFVVSFGFSRGDVNSSNFLPTGSLFSRNGKTGSVVSRVWLSLIFFWVLILSVSFKIGTYIYSR